MNECSIPFGILVSFWMHRRLVATRHVPFPLAVHFGCIGMIKKSASCLEEMRDSEHCH
jgi:hypothetical protein